MPHLNIVHPQKDPFKMRPLIVTYEFSTERDVYCATPDAVFAFLRATNLTLGTIIYVERFDQFFERNYLEIVRQHNIKRSDMHCIETTSVKYMMAFVKYIVNSCKTGVYTSCTE